MPRHCLQCDYVLDHLNDARQCPECGRAFDPDDARTFSVTTRRQRRWRWVRRGAFVAFVLLIAGLLVTSSLACRSVACGRHPLIVQFESTLEPHVIGVSYVHASDQGRAAHVQQHIAEWMDLFRHLTIEEEGARIYFPFCHYRSGIFGRTVTETGPRYAVIMIELDDGRLMSTVVARSDAQPTNEIQLDWQQFTPVIADHLQ